MGLLKNIPIFLLLFICFVGFSARVDAGPSAKAVAVRKEGQTLEGRPAGQPPIHEQKITLAPFYCLQSNGAKAWIERILVTFTMAAPKNALKPDLDNVAFRKMFYELLQSDKPEATIQAQAIDHLKQQVGMKIDPAIQISRSVLIVR